MWMLCTMSKTLWSWWTSQLSLGPPYFHHCWEKLNKSCIDAITHRFAPTSRYWCPILALTTFESYPLMGLPPVPVTSRPYSSSRPMAIISKPRSEQSWLTKHLVGCATFTPTPTTATCCPYWHVLKVSRTCTNCGSWLIKVRGWTMWPAWCLTQPSTSSVWPKSSMPCIMSWPIMGLSNRSAIRNQGIGTHELQCLGLPQHPNIMEQFPGLAMDELGFVGDMFSIGFRVYTQDDCRS